MFSESEYEQLYTMLMSAIPSSVLLLDQDMRVILANGNFLEKARRSADETIGRRLCEVFPPVILDEMALEWRIQQVFALGKPVQGERMAYRAPGVPLRIYYYSIIPVERSEGTKNAMLLMEDVTEQIRLSKEVRQIECHLAGVVESASDIIVSTDAEGRIVSWNGAGEKVTGYTVAEVGNRPFYSLFAPDQQDAVKEGFDKLECVESLQYVEWHLVSKSDRHIPVSWVCSKLRGETGTTEGIVAVGRDLTERRKFEAQLFQSQKLAALGVMAGGIAHEIRNPLAVSSSAAQFLMEGNVTPEFLRECSEKILAGIHKASLIIENLLRFTRPSAPKAMGPVDPALVVKDTVAMLANEAHVQKIAVRLTLPKEPALIVGNACLLQQMVMNLILNAYKAMPEGGTLGVDLQRTAEEAVLRIRDTGCGIPGENLDKIFDPFFTTSRVGEGTGLGLSLCHSIVKQHAGTIEVESANGKGTIFAVKLPLAEAERGERQ